MHYLIYLKNCADSSHGACVNNPEAWRIRVLERQDIF